MDGTVEVELLCVGAGPAGASLAAFLAHYGLKGLMISAAPGTAETPRAHLTNLSALDALRDLGVVDDCYRLGKQGLHTKHYRWCETLAEEEYARVYSWGNDPKRVGDYAAASPNPGLLDLPQTLLEPILVRSATTDGFSVQFNTQLVSFTRDSKTGMYVTVVEDVLRKVQYNIICKYLFAADGGRSVITSQLNLPMKAAPGGGIAYNVLLNSDVGHLMENRQGNLHWNLRLKRDDPWMINTRMVKPWHQWLMGCLPKDPTQVFEPWTAEMWKDAWRDLVGDPNCKVEIVNMSTWKINEVCAETYSDGNAFGLGDAVHRHPPINGLGSNTCIGDAFNLAWKINFVCKGIAHPSLLETYTLERQPVGAEIVRISNIHLRYHMAIWECLGMQSPGGSMESKTAKLKLLKEESAQGREARKKLQDLVTYMHHETHALGLEMGHKYFSNAVYDADEPTAWSPPGREAMDPVLYYEPTTFPGRRLPHAWVGHNPPTKLTSTHDMAGKGKFSLFTGMGGQRWKQAAATVGKKVGLEIGAVSIGIEQDFEDVYYDWSTRRGVEEDGAVLVRPDLFVAWRAQECLGSQQECDAKLYKVMRSVLGWGDESVLTNGH